MDVTASDVQSSYTVMDAERDVIGGDCVLVEENDFGCFRHEWKV